MVRLPKFCMLTPMRLPLAGLVTECNRSSFPDEL